jgi:hypothetical protein
VILGFYSGEGACGLGPVHSLAGAYRSVLRSRGSATRESTMATRRREGSTVPFAPLVPESLLFAYECD